jgi:hypothetical protein
MNDMLTRSERPIPTNFTDRRVIRKAIAWDLTVAKLTDPELIALVIVCGIGLLVSVALMFIFPSFGEMAESLQALL